MWREVGSRELRNGWRGREIGTERNRKNREGDMMLFQAQRTKSWVLSRTLAHPNHRAPLP
jgi:hypothetical protein